MWLLAGCGGGGTLDQNGFEALITLLFIGVAIIVVIVLLIAAVIAVCVAMLAGAGAAVGHQIARSTMPQELREQPSTAYAAGSPYRTAGPPAPPPGRAKRMAGRAAWMTIWIIGVPFFLFFFLVGLPLWWFNR